MDIGIGEKDSLKALCGTETTPKWEHVCFFFPRGWERPESRGSTLKNPGVQRRAAIFFLGLGVLGGRGGGVGQNKR